MTVKVSFIDLFCRVWRTWRLAVWRLAVLRLTLWQHAETTGLRYAIPCATIRETNTHEYCGGVFK